MAKMLSKSRVLAARQCPRRLWLEVNRPALRVYDAETRRRFAQGHALNDVVHRLYPDGVLIADDVPLGAALKRSAAHLARWPQRPLFEATFSKHRVLVRADIFTRTARGFQLIEVKSSTRVKPYHLIDCAIQHWVIAAAGYPVDQTMLAHIETLFNYREKGNYSGLLRHVDVTEQVAQLLPDVPEWVALGIDVLNEALEPEVTVGAQCHDPFDCPFLGHCSPPETAFPVERLPGGGRIVNELLAEGIEDIRDIPDGRLNKPLQQRARQATLSGIPYIGTELRRTLGALPYPRFYLDFETIQFAIPRWLGTHPYEQIPFQWSCHIEAESDPLAHTEFLDISGELPLRGCAKALIAALGDRGPILTYSAFEKAVIRQLAACLPDLSDDLLALIPRLFDLLPLIKGHYYHAQMKGSFSIKAVLPTIAPDLTYDDLDEVQDGIGAQIAYEEAIDPAGSEERRTQLSAALRRYCERDTLAMVRLVQYFASSTG